MGWIYDITGVGNRIFEGITKFTKGNPLLVGAGLGVAGTATTIGLAKMASSSSRGKVRRKKRTTKKSKNRKTGYYPHTAGKRKDTSTRRIRFTKTGQPYVILSSGKARFIKKKSASNSRKRKGGRY